MAFSDIPERSNGPLIMAEWFNALRTAGIALEGFLGTIIGLTSFTIVNNQGSVANVTGLSFNGTSVKVAFIDFRIRRNTTGVGATELVAAGTMIATYKPTAGTWDLSFANVSGDVSVSSEGDLAGVVFTITNAGQIQYTSHNISGTADESVMKFTARTLA